jgi:predicted Rossmann-fold nucleotide-binding protein
MIFMPARNAESLRAGMKIIEAMPGSVAFIGSGGEPYADLVQSTASVLTEAQGTIRVGSAGGITENVLRGARGGSVYGFVRKGDVKPGVGLNVVHTTEDSTVHDVLLTNSLGGLVATPGGIGTLRTVFSLLTQIQTKKVPPVPIVLFGTKFWKPIFQVMKEHMLTDDRQLIKPEDLNLFTITDDKHVAAEVFRNFKKGTL